MVEIFNLGIWLRICIISRMYLLIILMRVDWNLFFISILRTNLLLTTISLLIKLSLILLNSTILSTFIILKRERMLLDRNLVYPYIIWDISLILLQKLLILNLLLLLNLHPCRGKIMLAFKSRLFYKHSWLLLCIIMIEWIAYIWFLYDRVFIIWNS